MKILIIILVMIGIVSANKYVDPVNGDDTKAGTISAPWKHINFATCGGSYGCSCTVKNTNKITAGDTLYLRAGTYHEHSIELTNSGTQTNPIVIKPYHGEPVTIDGDSAGPWSVFSLGTHNGSDWVVFDSLHIINGYKSGILLGGNTGHSDHITVSNCRFENTKWNDNTGSIAIYGYSHYITIYNCTIIGSGETNGNYCGIQIFRGNGSVSILNCDISNCSKGIYYKHCSIPDTVNTIIQNNFIHDNKTCGISISSNRCKVINNLIINNHGSGIEIWGDAGGTGGSMSRIEHNTVFNHRYTMGVWSGGQLDTNTGEHGACHDTIKNNIFFGFNGELGSFSIWANPQPNYDSIHNTKSLNNLYYNTATNNVIREFCQTYTLAQWKTKYPLRDSGSIQEIPVFSKSSPSAIEDFEITGGRAKGGASDGKDMGADIIAIAGKFPQITSSIKATGIVGKPFTYTITTTLRSLKYSDSLFPSFLKLDTLNGIISGTPHDTETFKIHFRAWNAYGPSNDFVVSISIGAVPEITSNPIAAGIVGKPFSYTITATMNPMRFSDSLFPSFLKLDTLNGIISGTPTDIGTSKAHLRAWNLHGPSNDFIVSIIISKDSSPVIFSHQYIHAVIGHPFYYKILATATPTSFSATGLPEGLKLNSTTGEITGIPTKLSGSIVTLFAQNEKGTSPPFSLKIYLIALIDFSDSTPILANENYKVSLSVNDTALEGLNFYILAGVANSKPVLIPTTFPFIKHHTDYPTIETSIPQSIIDQCKSFRAMMVISDSLSSDTLSLTRPIIRSAGNCDNLSVVPLTWTPLVVSALPDNQKMSSLLTPLFPNGSYDKTLCRIIQWHPASNTDTTWAEYGTIDNSLFDFKPGRLFWIKTRDSTNIDFGKATTVSLNDTFSLPIAASGWTDFSIPFSFSIPLSDILSTSTKTASNANATSLQIYSWVKNATGNSYKISEIFLPNMPGFDSLKLKNIFLEGGAGHPYTAYNPLSMALSLYIPPSCSTQTLSKVKNQAAVKGTGWSIRIKCVAGTEDILPHIYCGNDNNMQQPVYYAAPQSFSDISATVYDVNTGKHYGHALCNSSATDGVAFELRLSNASPKVKNLSLCIDSFINIPKTFGAAFFKSGNRGAYASADTMSISLKGNSEEIISVGVGNQGFLKSYSNIPRLLPGLYGIYPNPFRNHLIIRYSVPLRPISEIRFSLLDLEGKCIWKKTEKNPQPGFGEIPFSMLSGNGAPIGSKIYILHFSIIENDKTSLQFSRRIFRM